jgi:hypothetical protein
MQVSPFTQYFLRRLLRNYTTQARSLRPYIKVADPEQADIGRILNSHPNAPRDTQIRNFKLESLIETYSKLETQGGAAREALNHLENQILEMLGLRLGQLLPAMMPTLLNETQVHRFRFLWGLRLCEGMRSEEQFYGLVQPQGRLSSMQAYQLAWALGQKEIPCVITRSPQVQAYEVWVNLRSASAALLFSQGTTIVPPVLSLYSRICRFRSRIALT